MSLDVSLYRNGIDKDTHTFNIHEIRHLACNYAISVEKGSKVSFDEWFNGINKDWWKIANTDNPEFNENDYLECIYTDNITHNLGEMAEEAGIYEALWRPYMLTEGYIPNEDYIKELEYEDSVTIYAKDIIEPLTLGLVKLVADPEYYKKFDSPNGWGSYINFVPFVRNYLDACIAYPNTIVKTDR